MGYKDITIEEGKDPKDYHYTERRKEVLEMILEAGHPDLISGKALAKRYDVDPAQITRDKQRLKEEIHDDLSADAELISATVYRKGIRTLMDQGKIMEAKELIESWNDWLFDIGQQERAPDRMEMDLDATVQRDERKAFVGVDLGAFQGVDPSQMVGMDLEELDAADAPALEDGVEVELEGADGE